MLGQTGFLLVKQGNGAPHKLIHGLVGPALNVPLDHFFQLRSQMNLYDHSLPQVLTLLRFFALSKNSTPLFSNDSTLLQKKKGLWVGSPCYFLSRNSNLRYPRLSHFSKAAARRYPHSLSPYLLTSLRRCLSSHQSPVPKRCIIPSCEHPPERSRMPGLGFPD